MQQQQWASVKSTKASRNRSRVIHSHCQDGTLSSLNYYNLLFTSPTWSPLKYHSVFFTSPRMRFPVYPWVSLTIMQFAKHIKFDGCYDERIQSNTLPNGLLSLKIGSSPRAHYNHPIAVGVLPQSLRLLHLCCLFNQPIEIGALPNSITDLSLGDAFNHPLSVLPSQLIRIDFGDAFNHPVCCHRHCSSHTLVVGSFNASVPVFFHRLSTTSSSNVR